jgi:hypothetical protein
MKFCHKWHKGHLNGFTAASLKLTAAMAGLEAIECGEIGDGGNLFGVFRVAAPLSLDEARAQLVGHADRAIAAIRLNSNADYYSRWDTWAKIPRKLSTQIEERRVAAQHPNAAAILNSVYELAVHA